MGHHSKTPAETPAQSHAHTAGHRAGFDAAWVQWHSYRDPRTLTVFMPAGLSLAAALPFLTGVAEGIRAFTQTRAESQHGWNGETAGQGRTELPTATQGTETGQ